MVLSSIGLLNGLWIHYNRIGVTIYNQFSLLGFITFRIISFIFLYRMIFWRRMQTAKTMILLSAVYIYVVAVLWDMHTLEYLNIWNIFPRWLIDLHYNALYIIFKIFGLI